MKGDTKCAKKVWTVEKKVWTVQKKVWTVGNKVWTDDCCQCLLTYRITFPMVSPCIGNRTLSSIATTLTTNDNLASAPTHSVSYMSPVVHSFSKSYASDLYAIEEENMLSSPDDNEEYDDEDILLEIEPCIPFAKQMFPHQNDIFLQALCEFVSKACTLPWQFQW